MSSIPLRALRARYIVCTQGRDVRDFRKGIAPNSVVFVSRGFIGNGFNRPLGGVMTNFRNCPDVTCRKGLRRNRCGSFRGNHRCRISTQIVNKVSGSNGAICVMAIRKKASTDPNMGYVSVTG